MTEYITTSGEMWDEIAYKIYGSELYTGTLIGANPEYVGIFKFDGGARLKVPAPPEETENSDLPEWRKI